MTAHLDPLGRGHLGDFLSALLDEELPPAPADQARSHLAACALCADELARVADARAWVRSLPPVEPPASFYARVTGAASAEIASVRRRRAGVAALATSAVAGLAFLGLVTPQEPATAPPVPRLVEAHATAAGGGEPLSQLVSAGVPLSFRR